MTHDEFLNIFKQTNIRCENLLNKKRKYRDTEDDRLLQFKVGAMLRSCSTLNSTANMMEKHVTQLFQMVGEHMNGTPITKKQWRETIQDNINYLHLMIAVLEESNYE